MGLRGVQAGLGSASLPLSGAVAVARYLAEASGLIHSTRVLLQHSPAGLRQVNRTTAFVDVLDEKVFGGRTMQQISHAGLDVVLTACDLGTGGAVRFGSRTSAC